MPQTFDVKFAPLSAAIIQQTSTRYSRLELGYRWLWLPLAALSLFAGYEAYNLGLVNTELMRLLAGFMTATALLSSVYAFGFHVNKVCRAFSPLPQSKCQAALVLARRHPELESYRLAVVAERQFTVGDLDAMQRHVAAKDALEEKKEAEDIHRAACEALHRAN